MPSNALADQTQLWGFERNFAIFTDGSLGFGLDVVPIDVSSQSDGEIDQVALNLKNLLNSLPSGLDVQFVQDIKPGNMSVIQAYGALKKKKISEIAEKLTAEKVSLFEELEEGGALPFHSLKIFVRKPFDSGPIKKSIFSGAEKTVEISDEFLEREIRLLERVQLDLLGQLEGMEMQSKVLSAEEVLDLVYQQWNPGRDCELTRYDLSDVRDDLFFTDVFIENRGFDIADTHHRMISLKNLPDQTFSSMARVLRHLPFDARLFLNIRVPDQQKEIDSLKSQRRIAFSMATGKSSNVSDIESESKYQDLETLLQEMIAQGEKVFHASLNILIRSQDYDELDDQVSQTLSLIREMSGSEGLLETIPSFDIFKELAIPNARGRERERRLKTSNLVDLLPVYAPWRGHEKPSLMLRSAMGSLLTIDPFDSSHKNANQLISAGSGAGKSFFCNLALLQMLKEDPKVYLVDIGGSYQKLCENLDGQYIPLGVDSNIAINPFDLPVGDTEPSKKKIKFLVGLIELMTKEESSLGLPKLIRSMLEESIIEVYKTKSLPILSDLRDILMSSDSSKLRDVGQILTTWCGDTAFGNFIDKPTSVSLEKDLVSFDLKGLDASGDLQTVCLYLITDLIWSNIQQDRYKMKFVVFDECWKLLKDKAGQEFIESVFRTCRKYFTSCIAISQAIQDFANSEIASAIMPNCEIKWLLQQGQIDSTAIATHLGLNNNELALIGELRQKQGHYSQAYLVSGPQNRSIVTIEPSPLELWIATTNPKDLKLIEEKRAENPSKTQFEVLCELSEEFPHGVP